MYSKKGLEHVFSCENCEEEFESDAEEFMEAWEEAKDEGWKYQGSGMHACPMCGRGRQG